MAIDRGGLEYPIRVRDQFSRVLGTFRSQAAAARQELLALRRAARQTSPTPTKRRLQGLREQNAVAKQYERTRTRTVALETQFTNQIGRENIRLREQLRLTRDIAAARRQAAAVVVRAPRAGTTVAGGGRRAQTPGGARNAQGVARLNKELFNLQRNLDRATPSFKSFIVAIGASIVIREAINLFQGFVGELVGFSAELEQAELGIAGLLTAVGEFRDPFGNALEGAEALTAAGFEARAQLKQLQLDGLNTAATFGELAEAFQTALAPGVQAGLQVDEIRQFTVRISQAASAIGLAQNQLAEEIRSLLTGAITPRNTRIATSLGITNDDIRTAREAGRLFEFLTEKFEAFGVAGEESLKTFTTRLSNLKDAFQLVLAEGGQSFFTFLSDTVDKLQNLVATKDQASGLITLNPAAVTAIERISDGLSRALQTTIDLGEELGAGGLVATAEAVADAIAVTAEVLKGVVLGLGDAFAVIRQGFEIFGQIFGAESAEDIARLATKVGVLSATFVGLLGVVSSLVSPFLQLASVFGVSLSAALGRIVPLVIRLGGALALIKNLGAGGAVIAGALFGPIAAAAAVALRVAEIAKDIATIRDEVERLQGIAQSDQGGDVSRVGLARTELSRLAQRQGEQAEFAARALESLSEAEASVAKERRQADTVGFLNLMDAALKGNADAAARLVTEFGASEDAVREFFTSAQRAFDPNFLPAIVEFDERLGQLSRDRAVDEFLETMPASFGRAREELEELAESTNKLQGEAAKVRAQLTIERAEASPGASPVVTAIMRIQALGAVDAAEDLMQVTEELSQLESQVVRTEDELRGVDEALLDLGGRQAVEAADRVAQLSKELKVLQLLGDVDKTSDEAQQIQKEITAITESLDNMGASGQKFLDLTQQRVALQAELNRVQQEAEFFEAQRQSAQAARDTVDLLKAATAAVKERGDIEKRLAKESQEAFAIRLQLLALEQDRSLPRDERAAATEQLKLDLLRLQRQEKEEQFRLEQQSIQAQITQLNLERESLRTEIAKRRAEDPEANVGGLQRNEEAATEAITELTKLKTAREQEYQRAVEESNLAIEQQQFIADQRALETTWVGAFQRSIDEMLEDLPTKFEMTFQLLQAIVDGFARIASDAIVDALDPTAEEVPLKERFARLLQELARMLIQWAVRMAIVRAIALGTGGGGAAAGAAAAGGGLNKGGFVQAKGYASGGEISPHPFSRPKGLHPSDTVPIWAAPGEFMLRRRAVSTYGADFVEALNAGLIDPAAVSALSGSRRKPTRIRSGRKGYASGGQIADAPAGGMSGGGTQQVLVIGDREAELFGTAGRKGQVRSLRKNSLEASAALRFTR